MKNPIEFHYQITTSRGNGLFRTKQEAVSAAEFHAQFACVTAYQGNFDRYGASYGKDYEIGQFLGPDEDDE